MHCLQQGWYIILPSVKQTFGLSDVQYGGIESIRSASNTAVQIPSGVVSDMLRRQWVIIVVSALLGIGVAYAILGLAPSYGAVLLSAVIIGISIALWHPPALSVLSARLVERRGLALSIHGMGGNLGNAVGPAMMGVIIGAVAWQMATLIMAIPMVGSASPLAVESTKRRPGAGRGERYGQAVYCYPERSVEEQDPRGFGRLSGHKDHGHRQHVHLFLSLLPGGSGLRSSESGIVLHNDDGARHRITALARLYVRQIRTQERVGTIAAAIGLL